jgi:hypothetical protein
LGTVFKRELYQFVHSSQSHIWVPSLGAYKIQIGSVYLSFKKKWGLNLSIITHLALFVNSLYIAKRELGTVFKRELYQFVHYYYLECKNVADLVLDCRSHES